MINWSRQIALGASLIMGISLSELLGEKHDSDPIELTSQVHSELSGCGGFSCGARSGYFLRERTALVPQVGCADCPKPAPHATHSQRLLAS